MNEVNDAGRFRLLKRLMAVIACVVLLLITIGIIIAMWLPPYLASRTPGFDTDHTQEMQGMFPRGRD
jgi:hypothetical protein